MRPAARGRAEGAVGAAAAALDGAPALEVTDLSVRYGSLLAVRSACLTVRPGQVVALIGETGSGKSSLALAAARLLPATAEVTSAG